MKTHQPQSLPKKLEFTKQKYAGFTDELTRLQTERKAVIIRLQTAREMGDLSENGAYTYAKKELRDTDRKIAQVSYYLKHGQVITQTQNTDRVALGHSVTIQSATGSQTFTLIGTLEADPLEGKISAVSPLGKALLGKTIGEQVAVTSPRGVTSYTITAIALADL